MTIVTACWVRAMGAYSYDMLWLGLGQWVNIVTACWVRAMGDYSYGMLWLGQWVPIVTTCYG